jgi:hypothetical protein
MLRQEWKFKKARESAFFIEKFPGPSVLGFYWIRILPALTAISAVSGIYHKWLIGLGRLWNERVTQSGTSL